MANPGDQNMFRYVPPFLISIILSSLPFQEAARTSVLSKEWKTAWYSTKNIEFHERFFVKPEHSDEEKKKRRLDFLNFMQQWIQMHGERSADRLCLSFSKPQGHGEVMNKVINFALQRKVKVLEIDFSDPSQPEGFYLIEFHHKFWFCSIKHDIERLKLTYVDLLFESTSKTTCTKLKSLYLTSVKIPAERLNQILSLCPSLEILSLKRCRDIGFLMLTNVPSLKTLVIVNCSIDLGAGILLDAPNLEVLKYRGWVTPFIGENLNKLDGALLDFSIESEVDVEAADLLYNIFREVWAVSALNVCSFTLQAIQVALNPLMLEPLLEYVKQLKLKTELNEKEYHGITFFLNSCPVLEFLLIDIRIRGGFHDNLLPYRMQEHPFMTNERYIIAYECVRKTLKTVKVLGYRGLKCEERVIKYLLKYGCVLEKVEIHLVPSIWPYYRLIAQPLLEFPRASPYVHISFE